MASAGECVNACFFRFDLMYGISVFHVKLRPFVGLGPSGWTLGGSARRPSYSILCASKESSTLLLLFLLLCYEFYGGCAVAVCVYVQYVLYMCRCTVEVVSLHTLRLESFKLIFSTTPQMYCQQTKVLGTRLGHLLCA